MKTIFKFLFTLLILFAFSCSQETTQDPLPADLDGVSAKANSKASADVLDATDGTTVLGSATIHRNKNGITVNVKTSDLTPGYAYTLWIVAFNNPGDCSDEIIPEFGGGVGCDGTDLGLANGEVMYGTGHVVGGNGKGNFSAHLNENDDSGSINDLFKLPDNGGLLDAQTAEVHIVIRCHGPKIPGMVSEQIHYYDGGCNPGDQNVGLCADVQFAIFLP